MLVVAAALAAQRGPHGRGRRRGPGRRRRRRTARAGARGAPRGTAAARGAPRTRTRAWSRGARSRSGTAPAARPSPSPCRGCSPRRTAGGPGVVSADSSARSYWPSTRWPMNPSRSPSWRVVTQRLASVIVALRQRRPRAAASGRAAPLEPADQGGEGRRVGRRPRPPRSRPRRAPRRPAAPCRGARRAPAPPSPSPRRSRLRWRAARPPQGARAQTAGARSRSSSTRCQSTRPAERAERSMRREPRRLIPVRTSSSYNPGHFQDSDRFLCLGQDPKACFEHAISTKRGCPAPRRSNTGKRAFAVPYEGVTRQESGPVFHRLPVRN